MILCSVVAFSAQPNINGNTNANMNIGQSEKIPQQLNIAFVTGNKMKVNHRVNVYIIHVY